MSKVPADICLRYIDEIIGEVESGSCTPDIALVRISVWVRDVVALLDNGDITSSDV